MATPSTTAAAAPVPAANDSTATSTVSAGNSVVGAPSATAPASSLYVGELAPDVTEAMLFEIFNQIGPVASIRVCRDAVTRRSLGYAYVNYHNPADGDTALESLNFYPIKGHPCRIMWSQRDPSMRKKGQGNVFIKNLDKTIDSKTLCDTFSSFGNILSCKVATDENGSKGYGFVHFESVESAEEAIKATNGLMLADKMVYVGMHVPRRERESKEEEIKKNFTNVFVKNLPESVADDDAFLKTFKSYGDITSAVLSKDDQGVSKGFGFINFVDHVAAEKCVEEMNGKEIDGKAIYVGRAQKKSEREDELRKKFESMRLERLNKYQGVNLYVKNLDETIDDERLRQEFGVYGTITSARVMRDEKGESKGFAFVCFSAPEEATKAVTEMNNKIVGTKPVYVALAQRREARRSMLEAQYNARNQMRQQAAAGMIPMYGAPMMYPPAGQPGMPVPQGGFMYPGQMQGMRPGNMPYIPPQQFAAGGMPNGGRMPRPQMPRQAGPRPMPGAGGMMPGGVPGGRPGMYGAPQPGMMPQMAGGVRPPTARPGAAYKYNVNVRNANGPATGPNSIGAAGGVPAGGAAASTATAAPAISKQQQQQNTANQMLATTLAKVEPQQQRQMIGERLYPMVQAHRLIAGKHDKHAGKITGMLLEMEVSELLHLLESPDALEFKLEEAVAVLEQYLQESGAGN